MNLTAEEFNLMRGYIYEICGLAIRDEKEYLIRQRLEPLVRAAECSSFREYYHKLLRDPSALEKEMIISAITTNETAFFRDGHPFEAFSRHILPYLAKRARERKNRQEIRKGAKVRIWSAGASTGQEPYSIAIGIDEYINANRSAGICREDFDIMASDISAAALARAIAGKYTETEVLRGLSEERLKKYFHADGRFRIVDETIRNMVVFRQVNLARPFVTVGGFDVIFCRNVLIYFNEETKTRIFDQFHQILPEEGCLILGSTENIYGLTDKFRSVRLGETLLYYRQ